MLELRNLTAHDLQGLTPDAVAALAREMLEHIEQQAGQLQLKDREIERKDREIALREAKLEKVQFELARLKRWKFGAKTEALSADQRRLFEETLAEDEAGLQAQLDALRAQVRQAGQGTPPKPPPRRRRRQALPEHLRRVEHRHEPADTTCPSEGCGRAMTRIGEDVSERLDIIPAEFFVHRHIYGKWACRCCQVLKQQPTALRSSTRACLPAGCWPIRSSATSLTTCRTTGRRRSMRGPACIRHAQRSPVGLARLERPWSHCTKRKSASFLPAGFCMPMRLQ